MTLWHILRDERGFWGGFGKVFGDIAAAVLGSVISGAVAQGLNAAFSPSPPSRRDVQRDLEMQAQALRQPPQRTPEQEQADQMALEATRQRQATFAQLSKEYAELEKAGPQVFWDPYEEQQLRQEAMAQAATRGMAESGQAQEFVNRRLDEARLRRSTEAARLHEQKLSNLRGQMSLYSGVERPGVPQQPPTPTVAPLPRTVEPTFKTSPVNITALQWPGGDEEQDRGEDRERAMQLYRQGERNPYA